MDDALAAWTFPRELDLALAAEIAADGREAPDLRVEVLDDTSDTLTVEVVAGEPPGDPDALICVARRGPYAVVRREEWPGGCRRTVLVLEALAAR